MAVTIRLNDETAEQLEKLKHPGQTWDGIILELIQRDQSKQSDKK
jgi:predicted CopG family antitoxin